MQELYERSANKYIYVESDFLTLYEQDLIKSNIKKNYLFWGGYDFAEKAVAVFGNSDDIGYDYQPDLNYIHISPLNSKFSEKLGHRDYLGAIMSLGINRNTFGDLIVSGLDAYTICKPCISIFISENLTNVKHTAVKCEITGSIPENVTPKLTDISFVVSSVRIDSIISSMYKISRNESKSIIEHGSVMANGTEMLKPDFAPLENSIITVSGHGKFIYIGMEQETKKGRLRCLARIFS